MVGVVATWILPNTLEDILAVVLAGLAGYVALLNLPLRRAEAKGKLERVANNFIQVRNTSSQSEHSAHYHWSKDPKQTSSSSSSCSGACDGRFLSCPISTPGKDSIPKAALGDPDCSSMKPTRRLQEVEGNLKAELEAGLDKCEQETNEFMKPVEEASAAVVERVTDAERRRAELADELEGLKQRAASVE